MQDKLNQILEKQSALLDLYIPIQGLPRYPLDLKTKKAQKTLRELVGFAIEELSEAFNEHEAAYISVGTNTKVGVLTLIHNTNIELADAMHFIAEILVYTGLGAEDLKDHFAKASFIEFMDLENEDALDVIFHSVKIDNYIKQVEINMLTSTTIEEHNPELLLYAGLNCGMDILEMEAKLLWKLTQYLYKAINMLKHKDWTQAETIQLNEELFKTSLLEAMVHFFKYLEYMGLNSQSLLTIYEYKNKINHARIEGGY